MLITTWLKWVFTAQTTDMTNVSNSKLFDNSTGILKKNACVVIVRTEWNATIVDQLERGCIAVLEKNRVKKIISITVPGAVEIPFAVKAYWENQRGNKRPDAFITLGCVIRGDTPHFEYVSKAVTDGVVQLNLQLPIPTIFGVLTVENEEQAIERVGGKMGHNGENAAITALKMIALNRSLKK
jgi:6,7-dimethyl-8-ribityllumazine synthase